MHTVRQPRFTANRRIRLDTGDLSDVINSIRFCRAGPAA
jgi:hypothetical protein